MPRSITGKVSSDAHRRSHPMTRGQAPRVIQADPKREEENRHARSMQPPRGYVPPHFSSQPAVKKMNHCMRSVQPPRGYMPLHLRRNQRTRRRTAAQEAYNRPVVVRPLSFAATGGPTWGPRPTCHATGAPDYWVRKIAPSLAPMPHLLGAIAED
jgi:hypothetical protein